MRHRHQLVAAALALFGSAAHAVIVFDFYQSGNNVVAQGSGSASLAGLTFGFDVSASQVNVEASSGNFRGGATGVPYDVYQGVTIPPTGYGLQGVGFGPGTNTNNIPSSSSGDYFGLTAFNQRLHVPDGYISGTPLSNTTTWNNRTLANLGLAPLGSTFTYTWGSGANADSLIINITTAPVPEPSAALMWASGLALLAAALHRRRTRRQSLA